MDALLFEIGTEEIPAGYIVPALDSLAALLLKKLDENRIAHGSAKTFGTPRRLAVLVEDVAEKQTSVTSELTGPPVRAAYGPDGTPTMAAVKFAEKAGVPVEKLGKVTTPKGEYLSARVTEKGVAAKKVLAEILPEIIAKIPFPKSMRWADRPGSFARPVHSLLALLGTKPVGFTWNGVKSGRVSQGHFFTHNKPVAVPSPAGYTGALEEAGVIADIEKRKKMVAEQVDLAARNAGGRVLPDPELLDIVTNLVEFPSAAQGSFDPEFLEVPEIVLITAMRKHQKYFPVVDAQGKLMPAFIAVNNTRAKDPALVVKGHGRVLRARLSDARYFFTQDRKHAMEDWAARTEGILFQTKLGTMREKAARCGKLGVFLAGLPGGGTQDPALVQNVARAAFLCKADLVSEVVGEFPELQGIMGRIYAGLAGENPEVAAAIEEHYRPAHAGGELPQTRCGALLALADKLDSLCACFSVGIQPTGGSDPYALRRAAIGLLSILVEKDLEFSLDQMVQHALSLAKDKATQDLEETRKKVLAFLGDRMAHLLAEKGYPKDVVAAAMAVPFESVPLLWRRAQALARLTTLPDYDALAAAFKRVVNIMRQAQEKPGEGAGKSGVRAELFEKPCEGALWDAFKQIEHEAPASGDIGQALLAVARLRPFVDAFFDGVMVMADDTRVRDNRLALLGAIAGLFARYADFSKIATPKE
jgi:glycyl-tRNA synthetase beta chain